MDVDLGGFLNQTSFYDYNDSYEYEADPEPTQVNFFPFLFPGVMAVGLLGNGLLLAVLAKKCGSWSMSDTFILHQGVVDILLLLTLPFWIVQASQPGGWSLGAPLCKISGAVFNINFYCGIFLLVCISLVRCLSCLSSIQGKLAVSHGICLLVCLISLLLTIPDWISLMPVKDKNGEGRTVCVHNYSPSGFDQQLFSRLPHHTLGFLLPATILIICCSSILLQLQSRSKSCQKQRAVMVIVPLVTVFLLCWMPYNITLIVDTYRNRNHGDDSSGSSEGSLETALKVTFALGCVHACLRPLLYFGLCRNFRKRTLAMLRCATFEPEGSLWELGVDKEGLPGQSPEGEALKQITDKQHQV